MAADRLLDMLSIILSGQPYREPGAPHASHSGMVNGMPKEPISHETNDDIVILALTTLGTMDFNGRMLHEFVRDCVVYYLDADNADVRKAAAVTTCQLFIRDPICYQTSNHAIEVMRDVLGRLLSVAVADSNPHTREVVISSLDERFDQHLAQAEHVRALFLALNDEVFAIREIAMSVIGRLAKHNPAYVIPSLRKTLIQLLTELEYSTVSRNKEESALLLTALISAAQRFLKPYVDPILRVLLLKASDPVPGVVAAVLGAIGQLAEVGGEDMQPYLAELMPIILEALQDQSASAKRHAALHTLGQLTANTGFVIEPYLKYPSLLPILIDILNTEQTVPLRRETVKLLGILGALDPYRYKVERVAEDGKTASNINAANGANADISLLMVGMGPSSEDYFPTVAINALLKILREPSLSSYHSTVIQAFMYMFKTLGLKCVPFLPQIIPTFLNVMRSSPAGMLDFYFQQLSLLMSIVKQHIRNYLVDIFALIRDFWNPTTSLQTTILTLIEAIAKELDNEFKVYLPHLLPHMLQILESDVGEKRVSTHKVLHALTVFGSSLQDYMHLVVPSIVRVAERHEASLPVRRAAVVAIGQLCLKVDFSDHASRIIHPFARILSLNQPEMRSVVMESLCMLVYQLGPAYLVFVPYMRKILARHHIQHLKYERLVYQLSKGEPLPLELNGLIAEREENEAEDTALEVGGIKKLPVNQQHLKKAWETSQRSTHDDWSEWLRKLSVELLKESPSHALRACAALANMYQPLARELFNAGFISCWTVLYDQFQDELVKSIETALLSSNIPSEILQTLLNLSEFMEHDDKALPINIRTLGARASGCHAYAKALHYKELEFISDPSANTIESLIHINNKLQQPDAAIGILKYAQQHHDLELKESWYEKLERWEDALAAYERKQEDDPSSFEITLGRMKCLYALCEWGALSQLSQERWGRASEEMRRDIAIPAAWAAWGTNQWDLMNDYIAVMNPDSPDPSFFRAILSLHRNKFIEAEHHITETRDRLYGELNTVISESYSRAYSVMVRVQMLSELEEVINYKKCHDQPERQQTIRNTWMKRLKGCQRNIEVWQRILMVRSSVVSPTEDMQMWIKFVGLCRKGGRLAVAERTLAELCAVESLDDGLPEHALPQINYAYLKLMWASGAREEALAQLREFNARLTVLVNQSTAVGHDTSAHGGHMMANGVGGGVGGGAVTKRGAPSNGEQPAITGMKHLLSRCYLKQGAWQMALQDEWNEDTISDVLKSYFLATHYDSDSYKAWHAWSLSNFEVISHFEKMSDLMSPQILSAHIVPAVQGFFRSLALASGNSLQDTLRLLTLWFKFGYQPEVSTAINEGFSTVSIDTWLEVIPQLIARIHAPSPSVRRLIHQLLSDIGRQHPQALVYSLTVASKSQSASRKRAALSIMDKMRVHRPVLVEQALLVSQELIRVSILWHEMWHEGLEEASRLYFGNHNIEGMFAVLAPLHAMMERGPETLREISFNQAFGRDLQEAHELCQRYQHTLDGNHLNQAWELYYQVFRRIAKQLPQLITLELQYVSPKLLEAHDLEIAVPGTYKCGEPVVTIRSFASTLTVIMSKQRPRKLSLKGSDGRDYQYLLKGHEDLRQDERVMQLFGLVNTLLQVDPETFKRHLSIRRYAVIPLSPNSGLIGWVPHTDTLHALIRDYRESKKILLNIEHCLMLKMAPDYDNLTLLQKVEVFEYALEKTDGQDLYRVLWLKSRNSEASISIGYIMLSWLERRTNYTRSLAVMSMVGYILGLGDRHPSNLMLERYTGKVVHIDFGDCFEVAMHREKFPERIPFRLTRMLVNAMEVSGIEGNFRTTCENTMRVLRENKESLMAVLEAFVYDPLINWRLMTNHPSPRQGRMCMHVMKYKDREEAFNKPEALNERAVHVITRVSKKLTGRDFNPNTTLDVPDQVEKLIQQARSPENLCQCYIGWCAFW
ncbi:armadillo-type protein [Syncephalis pseudoplumigaleata]|uniref:Serine/threonine-protein kinase TOR n=1 Tax=Syncephalis pseudoplumigaleata TaxID=1712513 RepID=A0A4P9Z3X0_9FUNG|nr:armadillo-type protein [Syncephalis pseudoplumigaleata]|eukprot:RKP27125.1 armadillo-type protein [Syncephalis pseudoplumigaleata]